MLAFALAGGLATVEKLIVFGDLSDAATRNMSSLGILNAVSVVSPSSAPNFRHLLGGGTTLVLIGRSLDRASQTFSPAMLADTIGLKIDSLQSSLVAIQHPSAPVPSGTSSGLVADGAPAEVVAQYFKSTLGLSIWTA